jgi:hypothetical protein
MHFINSLSSFQNQAIDNITEVVQNKSSLLQKINLQTLNYLQTKFHQKLLTGDI